MTAHKVVIIECDECETTALAPGMILSDLVHMVIPAPSGVVEARHDAGAKGWSHGSNGKDLCPNCGPVKPDGVRSKLLTKIPHPHLHGWGHS